MSVNLERELADLGGALDVPPAPLLLSRLATAIEADRARPRASVARRRLAAALAAVTVGVVAVGVAPTVADWLGVGAVEVRQEPAPPSLSRLGGRLDLGTRVTRARAADALGRRLLVPAQLGEPDAVWLDRAPGVPVVTFVYGVGDGLPDPSRTGIGALFSQVDASIADAPLWTKFADDGSTVTEVDLGTGRALWIAGSHYVALRDRFGNVIADRVRLAANVLLWELDGLTLRLETSLDRESALAIGRSVR